MAKKTNPLVAFYLIVYNLACVYGWVVVLSIGIKHVREGR